MRLFRKTVPNKLEHHFILFMSHLRRIIGIDYGSKRIGIAVSDPLRIISQSVAVFENSPSIIDDIKALIRKYNPEKIVIGNPVTLKGVKGAKAEEVDRFITVLERELQIEIVRFDERFTSKIAQQTLRDMGVKKKKRQIKASIDAMAAALILQGYLDQC